MSKLDSRQINTPAFVFDEAIILENILELVAIKKQSGCKILYSIKALPLPLVLNLAKHYLDGFSVSSLFEARLAREILNESGSLHITTPGLRDNEFDEISQLCSHISFNSASQYQRLGKQKQSNISRGLRINPKLSFAPDSRFDPCGLHSKLGVDIDTLKNIPKNINGLHFHTVFSNTDYQALEQTVECLEQKLRINHNQIKWINLGGGYLYNQINNHHPLISLVKRLIAEYAIDVYIEPGKAIVDNAGYLVTTVIDEFMSDGKAVAVLDTSVSHHPEIFEYQRPPELLGDSENNKFECLLVGSSCLAGDVMGEYHLAQPPRIGDRIIFSNVGAYSLVKASRFNGYNLPSIYALDRQQNIKLINQSHYSNYRELWISDK